MKSGSRACIRKGKKRTRRSESRCRRILLFSSSRSRLTIRRTLTFVGRRGVEQFHSSQASCPHKTLVRKRFTYTHIYTRSTYTTSLLPFKFSSALFNEARIARRPHLRNFAACILPNHHRTPPLSDARILHAAFNYLDFFVTFVMHRRGVSLFLFLSRKFN